MLTALRKRLITISVERLAMSNLKNPITKVDSPDRVKKLRK